MKNIQLLPTDKPSRLVKFFTNKYHLCKDILPIQDEEQYQNIYITSGEEPKEWDWIYRRKGQYETIQKATFPLNLTSVNKKIILTTDENLINDGVQRIDDEFLEWFVQNPSCEFVKWNAYPMSPNGNVVATNKPYPFDGIISNFKIEYKIIIPKENLKELYLKNNLY